MEESIEIIRCEIPCEKYERHIKALIEQLLKIDEETEKSENKSVSKLEGKEAA